MLVQRRQIIICQHATASKRRLIPVRLLRRKRTLNRSVFNPDNDNQFIKHRQQQRNFPRKVNTEFSDDSSDEEELTHLQQYQKKQIPPIEENNSSQWLQRYRVTQKGDNYENYDQNARRSRDSRNIRQQDQQQDFSQEENVLQIINDGKVPEQQDFDSEQESSKIYSNIGKLLQHQNLEDDQESKQQVENQPDEIFSRFQQYQLKNQSRNPISSIEEQQSTVKLNKIQDLERNPQGFHAARSAGDRGWGAESRMGRGRGRGRGATRGRGGELQGRGSGTGGRVYPDAQIDQNMFGKFLYNSDDQYDKFTENLQFRNKRDNSSQNQGGEDNEQEKEYGYWSGQGQEKRQGQGQGYEKRGGYQPRGAGQIGTRRRGSLPLQRNPFETYSEDANTLNRLWQINDQITRSRNLEQLWQVVETHQEELVAPHFGQTLTRTFGLIDSVQPNIKDGFLQFVFGLIAECMKKEGEEFPVGVLVQIFHSLGRLKWGAEEYIMFGISEAATRQMGSINANGITKVIYGLAVSGHFDWDLLRAISLRLKHFQGSLSAYSIGIIIWSYAKIGYRDVDAIRTLCNAFSREVTEANGRDMSQFVWSLHKLEYKSDFLLKIIADNLCLNSKLRDLHSGDIAVILYSYASQGIYSQQFFQQMCREAAVKLPEMECSTCTNIAWACAKTGHLDEPLFRGIAKKMYEQKDDLVGGDVAMTSWAFSTLNLKNPDILRLLEEEMTGDIDAENARKYSSKDVSQVAIAIRQFGLQMPGLMEGLIKRSIPVLSEVEPQGYVHLLDYLSEQQNPPKEIITQLLNACSKKINQFSLHELSKLTFAISNLPTDKTTLITQISSRLMDSYQPMSMMDISKCMDVFLRWGHKDLVDYLFGQSLYKLKDLSPQEISFTCQCLKKLQRQDASVVVAINQAILDKVDVFNVKDVSMVAFAFAEMNDVRPVVFEVLAERAIAILTAYLEQTNGKNKNNNAMKIGLENDGDNSLNNDYVTNDDQIGGGENQGLKEGALIDEDDALKQFQEQVKQLNQRKQKQQGKNKGQKVEEGKDALKQFQDQLKELNQSQDQNQSQQNLSQLNSENKETFFQQAQELSDKLNSEESDQNSKQQQQNVENVENVQKDVSSRKNIKKLPKNEENFEFKQKVVKIWGGDLKDFPVEGVNNLMTKNSDLQQEIFLNIQKILKSPKQEFLVEKRVLNLWKKSSPKIKIQNMPKIINNLSKNENNLPGKQLNNQNNGVNSKNTNIVDFDNDQNNDQFDGDIEFQSYENQFNIINDFEKLTKMPKIEINGTEIDPLDLASLAWAFNRPQFQSLKLIQIIQQILQQIMEDISPEQSAKYLILFSQAGITMKNSPENLATKTLQNLNQLNNNQLLDILNSVALARDRFSAMILFLAISNKIQKDDDFLNQLSPKQISNVVWSFGNVKIYDRNLIEKLLQISSDKKFKNFHESDLSKFLWGISRLRHFDHSLFEFVFLKLKNDENSRKEFDLPLILFSFAVFANQKFDSIFDILKQQIFDQIPNFSGQQLQLIFWSYGILLKGNTQFWEKLIQNLTQYYNQIDISNISLKNISDVQYLNQQNRIGNLIQKELDAKILEQVNQLNSTEKTQKLTNKLKQIMKKMGFRGIIQPKQTIKGGYYEGGNVAGLINDIKVCIIFVDAIQVQSNNFDQLLRVAKMREKFVEEKGGFKVVTIRTFELDEIPEEKQEEFIQQTLKLAIPSLSVV